MNSVRKASVDLHASEMTCDPCRFAGKPTMAVKYCKDCNGHFCLYCSKSHIKAPMTKLHVLINLTKKRVVKSSTRIQEKCHDHGAVLISYCETHEALCCSVCILTNHKLCKKVLQLNEAAVGKRAFRMSKDLESTIKKMQNSFREVQIQKEEYIKSIEQQLDAVDSSIKMFRKAINGILDNLEDTVNAKKEEICQERNELVKSHVKTSQTAINILNDAYKQLDHSLKESDAEMFIRTRRVQGVVQTYAEVLARIQPMPQREVFRFIPDNSIEKFLGGLKELGELTIEIVHNREYEPSIASSIQGYGDHKKPNFANDIKVKMRTDKKACFITGVSFLLDGRVILADDSNKNVKLFGTDYKPIASIPLSSSPRDIATLSHVEIAVTLPNEKMIQILKIGNKEIEKDTCYALNIDCYGITFHEDEMYVTSGWSSEREIQVLKPSGEFSRKIRLPKGVFRYPLYITIDPKSKIMYVSDYINGIIALEMSGKMVFQCKNKDIGTYYKGLSVTTPGQIYVCTWQQNGVQRVHADGKGLETVLHWKISERRKPLAAAYTSKTKRLILSFCGDKRDVLSIYKFY